MIDDDAWLWRLFCPSPGRAARASKWCRRQDRRAAARRARLIYANRVNAPGRRRNDAAGTLDAARYLRLAIAGALSRYHAMNRTGCADTFARCALASEVYRTRGAHQVAMDDARQARLDAGEVLP